MESKPTRHFEPRVLRHHAAAGDVEYAVHEVYFDDDGRVLGYTEDALSPRQPSLEQLREALLRLLAEGVTTIRTGDLSYEHDSEYVEEWLACLNTQPIDATENTTLS
jgi:hypothetical protein